MYDGAGYAASRLRHNSWQAVFSAVRDMGRGARVLLVILFLGLSVPLYSQVVSSGRTAGCPGDTVDRMSVAVAKQSRVFSWEAEKCGSGAK